MQSIEGQIRGHIDDFKNEASSIQAESDNQRNSSVAKNSTGSKAMFLIEQGLNEPNTCAPIRSGVPLRNYEFIGRESILSDMHRTMQRVSRAPTCCVLNGIAGGGNTEAATQYTYRYPDAYEAIFWLSAQHIPDLETAFSQIATSLRGILLDPCYDQEKINVANAKRLLEETSASRPDLAMRMLIFM